MIVNDFLKINNNLLIVNDDIILTKSLTEQFGNKYQVFITTNIVEAFVILERENIQVILANQQLPGMAVIDFFSQVKDKYPDILNLIITNNSKIHDVISAINKGNIFWYISKPLNPDKIDSAIKEAFKKFESNLLHGNLISSLRETNQQLKQSNLFIESVINASNDIIYIYDLQEGKIVFLNKGIRSNLGYSEIKIKKMGDKVLLFLMHPDDFKSYIENNITRYDSLTQGNFVELECRMKDKNGDWHWFYVREMSFLPDSKNRLKQIFGIAVDITKRKKAEEAVRISEQQFKSYIDNAGDAIYILEQQSGKILNCNKRAYNDLGYSMDELLKLSAKEIEVTFHSQEIDAFHNRLNPEEGTTIEGMHKRKDGTIFPVEIRLTSLAPTQPGLMIAMVRDITERKKAENALQESERKFRETIINLDEGYYSVTLDGILLDHNQAFARSLGYEKTTNLRGRHLPDFWINPDDRLVYLKELDINGSVTNFQINAKKKNGEEIIVIASAHIVKDQNNIPVRIDGIFQNITEIKQAEDKLQQKEMLLNLMGRAAKIGGWELDTQTMILTWTEEVYCIHELDFSFNPNMDKGISFYALNSRPVIENALQRAIEFGESFDLELEFITAKGNQRWIHSIGKAYRENGKTKKVFGSFQDVTERLQPEKKLINNPKFEGKTILVVDDVDSNYLLLKNYILKTGAKVIWAKSGEESVEICKTDLTIDLVLMDIRMPGIDGYEATRQIKQFRPKLKIIAQTAYALKGDREQALYKECDDYIAKPIRLNDFLELISNYLE